LGAILRKVRRRQSRFKQPAADGNTVVKAVDCLIVGGGPAGLMAATYLGRFRRNVLLIDDGASRAAWIPVTHNIVGYSEGVTGPGLLERMRRQADQYGARRMSGHVKQLQLCDDGSFCAAWNDNDVFAAKVLIATGGLDVEPQIQDAQTLVRDGLIRHCPICDAYEATGKRIALIAYGKCRIKEALLLRGYTADLTVVTLGHPFDISPDEKKTLEAAGVKIVLQPVQRLSRESDKVAAWQNAKNDPLLFDAVYSALGMQLRSELAISVGAKVDPNGALLVSAHQETSVPGMYAAGDIVHGLSQVSVAAGQAAIAATAINAGLPTLRYS
jgi:thioredoxin reductase (NADPH)